jgi:hypothetical protein
MGRSCYSFLVAEYMRRLDAHAEAASVRLSRTQITPSLLETPRSALFLFLTRTIRPVTVFVLLSLGFGSAITFVNPPLRGPDEISHFLRIYSYSLGELLPPAEIDGRKGVFVERALYDRLYFFKNSGEWFATFLQQRKGEWFARTREEGVRYGQIMAEYQDIAGASGDEAAQTPVFAPFAGTEGYSPVAYASLYPRGGHRTSAQPRLARAAVPDALPRPGRFHSGGGLCYRGHSRPQMGVCAGRDAAGIAL